MSYGVIQTSLSVGVGNGKQEDVEKKCIMCEYCNNLSHVNILHKQQEECVNKTSTVNCSFRAECEESA